MPIEYTLEYIKGRRKLAETAHNQVSSLIEIITNDLKEAFDEIERLQSKLNDTNYHLEQSQKFDPDNIGSMTRAYLEADVRVSRETIEHQKLEIERLKNQLNVALEIINYVTHEGNRAELLKGVYSLVPDELIEAWLKTIEEGDASNEDIEQGGDEWPIEN